MIKATRILDLSCISKFLLKVWARKYINEQQTDVAFDGFDTIQKLPCLRKIWHLDTPILTDIHNASIDF